ncbi:hypothetical protein K505DRAFT_413446 [Melanomma pulvis-pyrius CBS 109.77]|uniref:Uncharacterized protein n=1 Tax=Melanomma pulvis-pyrius CBS 109.77 TaxID=1314802 RepID=A0A6A6XVL1_9PLEO|nr:hypothetical protein K505DRAFT_413446 [Melanomma pulvis-pyrius CBS 109.77]
MRSAMPLISSVVSALLLCNLALSIPISEFITPTGPPDATSTACGDLIVAKEQGYRVFWAEEAFECLKNVPFDPAVATRFIHYYNQTLQFQSTLALLKNTPEGYQQPSIDVVQELWQIQGKVDAGLYQNQYVFEADVQLFVNRIHDAHVYLQAGILAPFTFASPYGLISASPDGKTPPAIYLRDDIIQSRLEGWNPFPITQINGIDTIEYLTAFAELNSIGYLEPHADWNALLESPALDIQGSMSVLQSATFYPGDELNFTLANTTVVRTWWLALYDEPYHTGPLTTPGDFYNYFVLGYTPASFDPENPGEQWWPNEEIEEGGNTTEPVPEPALPDYGCADGTPLLPNWCDDTRGAYPNDPVVAQEDLSTIKGGIVTGYILNDISTGVLSIPSFWETGNDTNNFFKAVDNFISIASTKKVSRIVIDLQQNRGGLTLLALSVFKRFFYEIDPPYTGSRIRSHELANTLGNTYSEWWDGLENGEDGALNPLYKPLSSSEWVVTNRINEATSTNFTSWPEYSGPSLEHSAVQQYNLSDEIFDIAAFQRWIPYGYGISVDANGKKDGWAPENIVLLTDGLCSSACAYFVELMSHQAGVKTVVVGGRPSTGPMQTASGNRGARLYSGEAIDVDFANVDTIVDNQEVFSSLPSRADRGMWIDFAGFNIRDQMRKDDLTKVPLQFKYDAADCRIYHTIANVHNMTQLWRDAAAATWDDPSLCVEDSTGYSSHSGNSSPPKPPPARAAQTPVLDLGFIQPVNVAINTTANLINFGTRTSITASNLRNCPADSRCGGTTECLTVDVWCSDQKHTGTVRVCLPPCSSLNPTCSGEMECQLTRDVTTKKRLPPRKSLRGVTIPGETYFTTHKEGNCVPPNIDPVAHPSVGCPV